MTDAEGCFVCIIKKSPGYRLGWRVEVVFQIALHKKDLELLNFLKAYFGGAGTIAKSSEMCAFRVTSLEQITNIILPHFDEYSLITQKRCGGAKDYILWRKIVLIMLQKGHLTEDGLQTILNMRASLNLGLSETLKATLGPLLSP